MADGTHCDDGRRGGPRTRARQVPAAGVERRPALPASEVLEGASELRIMLCRPKQTGGERSSSSIVAACGIYMKVRSAAQTDMNK